MQKHFTRARKIVSTIHCGPTTVQWYHTDPNHSSPGILPVIALLPLVGCGNAGVSVGEFNFSALLHHNDNASEHMLTQHPANPGNCLEDDTPSPC